MSRDSKTPSKRKVTSTTRAEEAPAKLTPEVEVAEKTVKKQRATEDKAQSVVEPKESQVEAKKDKKEKKEKTKEVKEEEVEQVQVEEESKAPIVKEKGAKKDKKDKKEANEKTEKVEALPAVSDKKASKAAKTPTSAKSIPAQNAAGKVLANLTSELPAAKLERLAKKADPFRVRENDPRLLTSDIRRAVRETVEGFAAQFVRGEYKLSKDLQLKQIVITSPEEATATEQEVKDFHAALLSLKWSEFSRFMDLWSRRPFEIPLDENGKPQFTVTKAAEAKKGYHAILVNRNKKHHQERLVQKHGGVPLPKPSKKDKRKAAKKNEDGEDDEENVDTKDEEDEADAPSKSKLVSASSSTTTVAGNVAMRIKLAEEATKGKKNLAALMAEFASDE